MRSRRLIFFLGLAAAIGIGVSLRLATRAQLTAGPRVRALGSDDDYHLRRARFALDHYPRTIIFDALMNFPRGGVGIWPPLYDVALATPTRLLHGPKAEPETLEREAACAGRLRGWCDPARRSLRARAHRAGGRRLPRPLRGALAGPHP